MGRAKSSTLEKIKDSFGEITQFGQERYLGFCKGALFFVVYCDGKKFVRCNPVSYSILGMCREGRDGRNIHYILFPGLTDPLSFLLVYFGTVLILNLGGLSIGESAFIGILWYICVAVLTFLASKYTSRSKKKKKALEDFMEYIIKIPGNEG
ncbi:MAG: hypothetical protein IJA36_10005 [Lachnospiraceae bacterium]|nr:hypothetical protein [Lachnospiraceae bacterium]